MRHFEVLNTAIAAAVDNRGREYDKRTRPRMRKHLGIVQGPLIEAPISRTVIATVTAIDIWRAVADELARRVCEAATQILDVPDSTLHNQLLIAGYFWVCNLTSEILVSAELQRYSFSLLSVQGALVDIVERVSPEGVGDKRLTLVSPIRNFSLKHRQLSPLLDLLVDEVEKTAKGQGFLMRWLGTLRTDTSKAIEPTLMQSLRSAAYSQYECSVLAMMALSGIEQLLRTFAHSAGLFEGQKRFTPARLAIIVAALGRDSSAADAIATIYDNARGNLRNRILHGAQLQITRSQQQSTLSIADPVTYAPVPDAFSPENVLRLCYGSLQTLDACISNVTKLRHTDLAWTSHLEMAPDDLLFGRRVHSDFVGEPGKLWWERIDHFLDAVTPNIRILFDFFFMGWIDRKRPDRLALFMALNMVLEALFRASARVHGDSVLKHDVPHNREEPISFRYKMLDQHELCSPGTFDRLVEHVDPMSRGMAKEVLSLAVKLRDAVAHGAVLNIGPNDVEQGHLVVKAIQCLVAAGEHEMIQTAAYYRWKGRPERDALTNWLDGEKEVLNRMQVAVDLRRRV
jgi:hypothetical protein